MLTDEQKAAGWIEHDGKDCPVPPDSIPEVMFRNHFAPAQAFINAGASEWYHSGDRWDIIAYRPENPHD